MAGSTGEDEIVATTKFKPSKPATAARQRQQQDNVIDDWDAESSDGNEDSAATATDAKQADVFQATKDQWTEA